MNISAAKRTAVTMNSGAHKKVPGNSLPNIRKNTIPFQAKVNARYAFMRLFVVVLGLANRKYVNVIPVTIVIICIGKIALLYAPTVFHQSSPFIARHLLTGFLFVSILSFLLFSWWPTVLGEAEPKEWAEARTISSQRRYPSILLEIFPTFSYTLFGTKATFEGTTHYSSFLLVLSPIFRFR